MTGLQIIRSVDLVYDKQFREKYITYSYLLTLSNVGEPSWS